jgi:hypothetical protein
MHRSGQDCSYENPYQAGKIAELCRKDRPDERSGAGYRGEMMAEKNVFIRRVIIMPVPEPECGGDVRRLHGKDLRRDKGPVEPVCQDKNKDSRNQYDYRIHSYILPGQCGNILFSGGFYFNIFIISY